MKEAFEKILELLEEMLNEPYYQHEGEDYFVGICEAISIVKQVVEEYKKDVINQIAESYAICLEKYGVDIMEKWETATQNAFAMEQAYLRGRQDERDKFDKWREEYGDEWISCSEDFPKENGWYECWCIISAIGENKEYRPKTLYWEDNLWLCNPNGFSMPGNGSIVAWKHIIPYWHKGE